MMNEKTKETRKLSTAIASRTAEFSNPRFRSYVKDNEPAIRDRLYKACVNESRDCAEYIAYAESVLIDQEMEGNFGWFEDIVPTVIDVLREVNRERCCLEETMDVVSFLREKFAGKIDNAFKSYLMIHGGEIKLATKQKLNYYDSPVGQMKFIDDVLEGNPISSDKHSWFADIAGTLYGVIMDEKNVFESIKNERSQAQTGGFDVYKWAEDFPGADYFDQHTGYVYRCADYMRAMKFGLPTPGIAVVDSMTGQLIGYATKN